MSDPNPSPSSETHALSDLSTDDGGRWWWLCACESAEGGHFTERAAHRAWAAHRDANANRGES